MSRVLIADDHRMFADGISSVIKKNSQLTIAGIVHNGEEVLNFLKNQSVDLVIMDINMPVMSGLETLEQMRINNDTTKILIVSMHLLEGHIKRSIEFGAQGYILKESSQELLIHAINQILEGKTYFSQEVIHVITTNSNKFSKTSWVELSEREQEILNLLSEGLTSGQIARQIALEVSTIKTYRRNLLTKFEAKNVSELIKLAVKNGYLG